jgi:hypothetical protein
MSIKIYKYCGSYYFSKNNVYSNFNLSDKVKPYYSSSWEAYKFASQYSTPTYQEDGDLKSNIKLGEEHFIDHFESWYGFTLQRLRSLHIDEGRGVKEEKKVYFKMVSDAIDQLDSFEKKLREDYKDRGIDINRFEKNIFNRVKELKDKYEGLINNYLRDIKKEEDSSPEGDLSGIMEEGMAMSRINIKNKLLKVAKAVSLVNVSKDYFSKQEKHEILSDIGDRVCEYLSKFHSEIIYKICTDSHHISVIDLNSKEKILRLYFNDYLILNKIYPLNSLKNVFPINSHEFFERYWKPIVNIVGFYHLEEKNKLIVPEIHKIPDIPYGRNDTVSMGCWDTKSKSYSVIELSFSEKEKNANWFFKSASTNAEDVSQDDLLGTTFIKCTDSSLKSIYGKIGVIVQVIEGGDTWYVDVEFIDDENKRIVRLSPEQIDISDSILELKDNGIKK